MSLVEFIKICWCFVSGINALMIKKNRLNIICTTNKANKEMLRASRNKQQQNKVIVDLF